MPKQTANIELQLAVTTEHLPDHAQFTLWASAALQKESPGTIVIRIVDPFESQQLNHDYRNINRPTNVLSFPFETPPPLPVEHLGDLVICADIVEQEAQQQKKPVEAHWAHMVIHGILHLQGYDHQNNDDAAIMESLEKKILANLGYPDPYGTL